eukprot:768809-Hanusia_phi.AAC.6
MLGLEEKSNNKGAQDKTRGVLLVQLTSYLQYCSARTSQVHLVSSSLQANSRPCASDVRHHFGKSEREAADETSSLNISHKASSRVIAESWKAPSSKISQQTAKTSHLFAICSYSQTHSSWAILVFPQIDITARKIFDL